MFEILLSLLKDDKERKKILDMWEKHVRLNQSIDKLRASLGI